MSRLKPAGSVAFPAPTATDVASFTLYYRGVGSPTPPDGGPDDGGLNYSDTSITSVVATNDGNGNIVVDLGQIQAGTFEGQLRVGLSALDGVGNESDISTPVEVPFDDVAPDAPGQGVFVPPAG